MIISWNVRGLNKIGKIKKVNSHHLDLKLDIIVLIKTRVKNAKPNKIRDKLKLRAMYLDNYSKHDNRGFRWNGMIEKYS